jgi:hypothetical protein
VDSWVAPARPWHVRLHRIQTERRLHTEEGSFALARPERERQSDSWASDSGTLAQSAAGTSAVRDLRGEREASVVGEEPNTNLYHPRTVVPTLRGTLESGTHWLATAALGRPDESFDAFDPVPAFRRTPEGAAIEHGGETVLERDD